MSGDLREWAKLDTEWYEDPDLIAAAEAAPHAFTMWPVLIAKAKAESHASRNPTGLIRVAPVRLAFDVRCDVDQANEAIDALHAEGMIVVSREAKHKVEIELAGFEKWQAARGSNKDKQQRKNAKKAAKKAESDTTPTPVRHTEGEGEGEGEVTKELTLLSATPTVVEEAKPRGPSATDVRLVFDFWAKTELATNGIANPKLTDGRRKVIRARLAEGYTTTQLMQCIGFFARDLWHLGENDRATRFTDLKTTIKSGEKVEAGVKGYLAKFASGHLAAVGAPASDIESMGY